MTSGQLAEPLPDAGSVRRGPYRWVVSQTVNVHEAKTHLSRLLEAVERGEDDLVAALHDDVEPHRAGAGRLFRRAVG